MNLNWKRIFGYHLRWQSGYIIAAPLLYLCQDIWNLSIWTSVFVFQFFGALIFYPIDNFIFKK